MTKKKEREGESNIYSLEKLLSFPSKVNNNNRNNRKKSEILECSCWVCKILGSVTETEADTLRYEDYNIVSETGDSIYSPQYEKLTELLDDDIEKGQVFVSKTAIKEIVNRIIDHHHKRLGLSINNNKNGN
jgi:hypothetical protein